MINSLLIATFLFSLLLSGTIQAKKFYNTEGKSIEAQLLSVKNGTVEMKLTNGRKVNVPITTLSTTDQNYIKMWWEKNKNLLREDDVKISIRRQSRYSKKPTTQIVPKKGKIKTSESEFIFLCELDNYAGKKIEGIKATYSVHKRVSKRGKGSSSSDVKITTNTVMLRPLESKLKFTTDGVKCLKMSNTITDQTQRETIIGMVLSLSVGGKEFVSQSHPENFIAQIDAKEIRNERTETVNDKREEQKDIADGKRGYSNQGRRGREDAEREKRKRDAAAAVAKRKAKEEAARKKNQNRFNE